MCGAYHHRRLTTTTTTTTMLHHLPCCFLVLLVLQQTVQANQDVAEDCREYCIKCESNNKNITPFAPLRDNLQVSLQVFADGKLPYAQITLNGARPSTIVFLNRENVTLRINETTTQASLTLATSQFTFWFTLMLTRAGPNALLVYKPEDRINVLQATTTLGSLVSVSSNEETHVAFNCLSGCLIRDASSALLRSKAIQLQPPFNLYLKPGPHHPSTPPVLTLTHSQDGANETVNASGWTPNTWYRVKVFENKTSGQKAAKERRDGVIEVLMSVPEGNYTLTQLKGFNWTLHCRPNELNAFIAEEGPGVGDTQNEVSTLTPAGGGGGRGKGNSKPKQRAGREGAGAGEVVAWVLAGLALFLVMVLVFALCTKTASPTHAQHAQDFQPSVGVLSFKDVGGREPEEDSEPESPTLTVPANPHHNPHEFPLTSYKVMEGEG